MAITPEQTLSYFLRNGFLNKEEQDMENAIYITKKLIKFKELKFPFKYKDFKNYGPSGVSSFEIRKILMLSYNDRDKLLGKSFRKVHSDEMKKLVRTAQYLSQYESEDLGVTAQYLYNGKNHLHKHEVETAKRVKDTIEMDLTDVKSQTNSI